MDRLQQLGHVVEHADFADAVGKGAADTTLARYSLERQRVIVTYDDDFVTAVPPDEYHCVLFFEDEGLAPSTVAQIVHNVLNTYPAGQLRGLQKVGREWL